METLYSDEVEILINGRPLIHSSVISINTKKRIAIIGDNGIGKTTLADRIFDDLTRNGLDVLKINQDVEIETYGDCSVLDHVLKADSLLYTNYKRTVELESQVEMSDVDLEEYNRISNEILSKGGWDGFYNEAKLVLMKLRFPDLNSPARLLSGGWKMKLELAKSLLRKPTLLILDEPTNHLDVNAIIWLESYLQTYPKTLIFITHQRTLINSIADICWYIGNAKLEGVKVYTCRGNYENVLQTLDDYSKVCESNYTKYKKGLDALRGKPSGVIADYNTRNNKPRPPKPYDVTIEFEDVLTLSQQRIIYLENVSFIYPGDKPKEIFRNVNSSIGQNSKRVLVKDNGAGKSTLIDLLYGKLNPTSGYVLSDDRLRVGFYHQQITDNLPLTMTPIQYLKSLDSSLDVGKCRAILGKLGIKKTDIGDTPNIEIEKLSGGQKARVAFASIQMKSPHLIIFDEPTNHLDMRTVDALINGINSFNGSTIIISHDLYFIESLNNVEIFIVGDYDVKKFNGNFGDYRRSIID